MQYTEKRISKRNLSKSSKLFVNIKIVDYWYS